MPPNRLESTCLAVFQRSTVDGVLRHPALGMRSCGTECGPSSQAYSGVVVADEGAKSRGALAGVRSEEP
jgi:hypothetical protein